MSPEADLRAPKPNSLTGRCGPGQSEVCGPFSKCKKGTSLERKE